MVKGKEKTEGEEVSKEGYGGEGRRGQTRGGLIRQKLKSCLSNHL